MSLFFALYLSLFVLTLSADSVAGISLHQLENQRHSNVEMRELLESKDNQQKALKQKNELQRNQGPLPSSEPQLPQGLLVTTSLFS
ncbi:uncharacterized protein LOC124196635 isoform X2 [Daphnia pulex]|uniref:uncharacterized protein LOC124196635 isoform X2 n=1 Tax=Daphnia pulex TaxID=6669 RepID=UPI001EDF9E36|nr:uncharacterized protein LOC124196635 isoform X2 [Daphnia pulex]